MKVPFPSVLHLLALLHAVRAEDPSMLSWRAYGQIVNQWLTGGAGIRPGIDYVFVTPPTTSTLQGGSPFPDAYTNARLYDLADIMQLPDAPIFATEGNRYVDGLQSYLNNAVSPGMDPTPEQLAKLEQLKEAQAKASDALRKERSAAIAAWNEDAYAKARKQTLDAWAYDNYPSYLQAKSAFKAAQARVNAYDRQINDPDLKKLDSQINAIETMALEPGVSTPGYNMPVFLDNNPFPLTPFQKNEITDPGMLIYKPLYTIPGYEETCDAWLLGKLNTPTTATLNFKTVSSSDWSQLGHSTTVKRGGGGFLGIISASKATTKETTEFTAYSSTFAQDVNVTLSMKGAPVVFPLKTGYWDVPGVRTAYPKLRTGKVDTLAGQIRPEKILIGYGVSFSIAFTDQKTWKDVKQFVETAQKTKDAGLSIFGFKFGAGGNGQYTRNMTEIKMTEEAGRGMLSLAPTAEGIFVMLGAYGKKF